MSKNTLITIVGIGMGNPDTLTIEARNAIKNAQVIIGATRVIETFLPLQKPFFDAYKTEDVLKILEKNEDLTSAAILFSGDIGFFSGAKKLIAALDSYGYRVKTVCGLSTIQYFCSKLFTSWNDVKILSLHAKNENVVAEVMENEKVFLLIGGENTVRTVCTALCENGLGELTVSVGERLSYDDELITTAKARELFDTDFAALSVMLIENKSYKTPTVTHGISDEQFIRGSVPMTKSEVRSVSLSKLSLKREDIIYDIGAGTGSVSVELSMVCSRGEVYAVEKSEQALEILKQNKAKFDVKNLHIIAGSAPEILEKLPRPTKAFIGGTAGKLESILCSLIEKNPKIQIVINAVTLETLAAATLCLQKYDFKNVDISQISVSKAKEMGNYNMLVAQNPVFVISAQKIGF